MNTKGRKLFSATVLAVLCLASSDAAFSQPTACLAQARSTISPGAWEAIHAYFSSLSIGEAPHDKARLIRLRAAIVQLEAAKQQLIDLVDAQARDGAADTPLPGDQSLARMPPILQEIESITRSLRALAAAGNLFAAEPAFRRLVLNVEGKRASSLCNPRRQPAASATGQDGTKPGPRIGMEHQSFEQFERPAILKAAQFLDGILLGQCCIVQIEIRKGFEHVRSNALRLTRPIVAARPKFNFHDRPNVAGVSGRKHRYVVKKEALPVFHIWIYL